MKLICNNCAYYSEGGEGEYGGAPFYVECSHSEINNFRKRKYCLEDYRYFPFAPAPGCFFPNHELLPDHFFKKTIDQCHYDYYLWLRTAKSWSGDHIELIE
jgi:hypothetical protein